MVIILKHFFTIYCIHVDLSSTGEPESFLQENKTNEGGTLS